MSVRTIILAVLGGVFIGAIGYYNDQVPRLNHFVGNHLPIIVFFPLIVTAAALNPLLGRLRPRWRLSGGELAVLVALLLIACNIPGTGLLRMWSRGAVMPIKLCQRRVDWNKAGVLNYVPPALLVNDGHYDEEYMTGILQGMGSADEPIAFGDVPWRKWTGPLLVWMPLVVLFAVASICLGLMVHRPWAHREHLPYPVAQLAGSLMGAGPGGGAQSLFRARTFQIGAAVVLAIHLINGLNTWKGGQLIGIPMTHDLVQILQKVPGLSQVPEGRFLFYVRLLPTVIAFACFVSTDVSFSVGISPVLWVLMGYTLLQADVRFESFTIAGGVVPWQVAGSTVAVGLMLIYIGRRHVGLLLRGALGAGGSREVKGYEVWACRVLLLSLAGLVCALIGLGLAWPVAVVLVLLFLLGCLVFARINVESGLFMIQSGWQPMAILLGVFGAEALGLRAIAIAGILSVVFSIDRRECLLPFVLNGLRVCDYRLRPRGRVAAGGVVVLLIALAVAVPFGLWIDHNYGLFKGEWWATWAAPWYTPNQLASEHSRLAESGRLAESLALTPLQRVAQMQPDTRCLIAMGIGAAAVLILYRLRLRYPWWPLHPIVLLVWGTWAMREVAYSFLIGCAIKKLTARFGIRHATLKTFMLGVIVGDLSGGALWMVIGGAYWMATGRNPPRYLIFPGG